MDSTQQPETEIKDVSSPPQVVNDKSKIKNEQQEKGAHDLSKTVFDPQSFTRVDEILSNLQHVESLQDIFDLTLNGLKAPCLDVQKFVPYSMAFSKRGVPVIGQAHCYRPNRSGRYTYKAQPVNFERWTHMWDEFDGYLVESDEKLEILWPSGASEGFLTKAVTFGQAQIDQGVRNARALARYVLGDYQALITSDIDTTKRCIRTDVFAQWMYNKVTQASGNLFIINASDLVSYLNTHVNSYPIPVDTLCLNLPDGASDQNLGKLALLNLDLIVDFNNSVETNGMFNGAVPCRVVAKQNVSANDLWIAEILTRTYSPIELELGLFLCSLWLLRYPEVGVIPDQGVVNIKYFKNTIQDQVLNFFYCGGKNRNSWMPRNVEDLRSLIWTFRIAKTCLVQKSAMIDGVLASEMNIFTGKTNTYQNVLDDISGSLEFDLVERVNPAYSYLPCWIPFEFWKQNGAKLELDDDDLVHGESAFETNKSFKVPRSIVQVTSEEYNSDNNIAADVSFFGPNSPDPMITILHCCDTYYAPCVPWTVKCYKSDTNTASCPYDPLDMVYYRNVTFGKNRNRVVRDNLGF